MDGRFKESYGANSKAHTEQKKLRHVPPFPMRSVVSMSAHNDWLLLQLDAELQLWAVPSLVDPPKLQCVIKKKVCDKLSPQVERLRRLH